MTALAAGRDTKESELIPYRAPRNFPVAAATTIYAGGMVATDASGNAVPASASSALKIWGRAEKTVINTVAAGFGNAGDLRIDVQPGIFSLTNGAGADAITAAHVGRIAYASDDQVVNLTDGAGLRPPAGRIEGMDGTQVKVALGEGSLWDGADDVIDTTGVVSIKSAVARNIVLANVADLTAYTVASDAALNDATLNVAGDIVLLVAQTTVSENGLYKVGTVATGHAPLTRVSPMPLGYAFVEGEFSVAVRVGTTFGNTKWFNGAAGTIGTDSPQFFPEYVAVSQVLTAGTAAAIQSIPLRSATKSAIHYSRIATGGTLTGTVGYETVPAPTPGPIGTASIVPMSTVAAGTIQNADTSTLLVTVINR